MWIYTQSKHHTSIFLNNICDQYDNLLIVGDFKLPNISWDSNNNAFGANEMSFVDALHDHYLSQIINIPTRGSNILDLVITSVPDHVSVTEVLSPDKAALFTDHNVITFEYAAHVKAPSKTLRYIYDYNNGDFNGLRTAIHEKNLSSLVTSDDNDDINTDWQRWSDAFMAAVKDHIPIKRLKGRNPLPWINGTILNLIKKKNSIRQKHKS